MYKINKFEIGEIQMNIKYPLTFKAAILEKNNQPLTISNVTFDGPLEIGQVLVKVSYSGICGKQIEEITGSLGPDRFLPHMLGHEGSGVVIDVGPYVKKVSPSDHVVLHWLKGSGINAATPLYHKNQIRINAGWITTFNEYAVVSENRVTMIPKEAKLDTACLLGCAATTGIGVILNDAKLRPNESVAIFGCGGIGLNAIQAAAMVHGFPIIAVDIASEALHLAKKLGATHVINASSTNIQNEINKITNDIGVKYVIIAVGNAKVAELALKTSSIPGTVYFVGVPPKDSDITISALDIHRGRTLIKSYGGGCNPDTDIPSYLTLNQKGYLNFQELISHVVSLDKINEGIKIMMAGKTRRCLVKMIDDGKK